MIAKMLGLVGAVAVLLLCFATSTSRSLVDWRAVQAIALESDDWGLAGFVPESESWQGLEKEVLEPGEFPAVYWHSTLEDSNMVDALVDVLAAHQGRDGVAAVFQPNYVMSSLEWIEATEQWVRHDLPSWPSHYPRPGLWRSVQNGTRLGVWHPEFHASLHYDPDVRIANAQSSDLAREVTTRGISLFPDSEGARELAPWRDIDDMAQELDVSLAIFAEAFGRPVTSVIAPDYTWHAEVEDLWQSRGLQVIQAKREQRNPKWISGKAGRLQKFVDRQWARLSHPGRIYLERNCRLEPVQAPDAMAVVAQCVADTRRAWRRGEPAIVETHRVNFSHTDPAVVQMGLEGLNSYLTKVCQGDMGPIFLADSEIAQLIRRGASWRFAGGKLVLRNETRGVKVVAIPADRLSAWGWESEQPRWFRLAAGETRILTVGNTF